MTGQQNTPKLKLHGTLFVYNLCKLFDNMFHLKISSIEPNTLTVPSTLLNMIQILKDMHAILYALIATILQIISLDSHPLSSDPCSVTNTSDHLLINDVLNKGYI